MSVEEVAGVLRKKMKSEYICALSEPRAKDILSIPYRASTGLTVLDKGLGGGLPAGRTTLLVGPESSGKTSLVLEIIRQVQAKGGSAVFIDAERSLGETPDQAESIIETYGIIRDKLIYSRPEYLEQAILMMVEACALMRETQKEGPILVALDSIKACPARAVAGKTAKNATDNVRVGLTAGILGEYLPLLATALDREKVVGLLVNQVSEKVESGYDASPGNILKGITTKGGHALMHVPSIIIQIGRRTLLRPDTGENSYANPPYGQVSVASVVKNKAGGGNPDHKAKLFITYGQGIDDYEAISDYCLETGLVRTTGGWIGHGEQKWHGKAAFLEELRGNPTLYEELRKLIVG